MMTLEKQIKEIKRQNRIIWKFDLFMFILLLISLILIVTL